MGYTHYCYTKGNVTPEVWSKITEGIEKIIAATPKVEIKREYNSISPPLINNQEVVFNGVGDLGHETFRLNREQQPTPKWQTTINPLGTFDFCKTARKPYDLLVCSTLLIAKHYAGDVYTLSSDGDWGSDWEQARNLVEDELGIKFEKCPFRVYE
jgi:hypothetical protein